MSLLSPLSRPALAPHVRLQTDRVTGDPVLLSPENILTLNPTSHEIITRCDGKKTLDEIIVELATEYDAPLESLRTDVTDLLTELHTNHLIIFVP